MFTATQLDAVLSGRLEIVACCCEGSNATSEAVPAELAALSPPPTLTGGLNCHEGSSVGVDWLTISCPDAMLVDVCRYLGKACGGPGEVRDRGVSGFQASCVWSAVGVQVLFDTDSAYAMRVHRGRISVILPGSFWSMFDGEGTLQILGDLTRRFWGRATRIDLAWDDFERRMEPHKLVADCEAGCVSGFRRWQHISPCKYVNGAVERQGDTVSFGRRGKNGSGKYLRVYDKCLESEGAINAVRWELELSGDRAQAVAYKLAGSPDVARLGALIGALIGGSIKFVERSGNGHLDRMDLLSWWADIVELLGAVGMRHARRIRTVEGTREWVESQVATSLAVMREVLGDETVRFWLAQVMRDGEERLQAHHRHMIALHERQAAA